jgi:hypothetical protein
LKQIKILHVKQCTYQAHAMYFTWSITLILVHSMFTCSHFQILNLLCSWNSFTKWVKCWVNWAHIFPCSTYNYTKNQNKCTFFSFVWCKKRLFPLYIMSSVYYMNQVTQTTLPFLYLLKITIVLSPLPS